MKKAVNAPRNPEDDELMSATAAIPAGKQPVITEGLRWGGIVLGNRSTKAQRVEAWGQEYYGAHAIPPEEGAGEGMNELEFRKRCEDEMETLKERLEQESRLWADLVAIDPLQAVEFSGEIDPWRIDAELKRVVEMRNRWDEVFGHIAMLFKQYGGWEPLEFADFGQYCEERLGMARRTVLQRVALERALLRIPLLRQALREKRISYEKARLIARHWERGQVEEMRPLIAIAERMTCVDLRESLTVQADEQMCARGTFTVSAAPSIFDLIKDALRALRTLAKRSVSLGMCLVELAGHFVAVWKAHVKDRMTKRKRILIRDRHRCQVPGCSRPAVHLHHIEYPRPWRQQRRVKPNIPLRRPSSLRHPRGPNAGHGEGARRVGLGIRAPPQLDADGGAMSLFRRFLSPELAGARPSRRPRSAAARWAGSRARSETRASHRGNPP